MRRDFKKLVRYDCITYMIPVTLARFFADLMAIVMPTINAYLVGNMADYLISLNKSQIIIILPHFVIALLLTVTTVPLFTLLEYQLMAKRGFEYNAYCINRFIHKPLREIQQRSSGEVLERLQGDLGDFCWNTVLLYSLPAVIICYGAVISWAMLHNGGSVPFLFILMTIPGLRVLKSQITSKKKAVFRRELSEYNEQRRSIENDIVPSRDFLHYYRLAPLIEQLLNNRYNQYMKHSGKKKRGFESRHVAADFLLKHGVPLCVLTVGSLLVCRSMITIGTLISGYLMLTSVERCYTYCVTLVEESRSAQEYIDRIALFYGDQEEDDHCMSEGVEMLCADSLSFAYSDDAPFAINNISLSIDCLDYVQIIGPNGCGKSTLLYILSGLYPASQGVIRDQQGNKLSRHQLRSIVALQEQNSALFSGTIQENLFISGSESEKASELLQAFGMEKPPHYKIEAHGTNLSPGEKKKIILVRALLRPSQFIIFDEPLNHLDNRGCEVFIAQIQNINKGIILVSHKDFPPQSCKMKTIALG